MNAVFSPGFFGGGAGIMARTVGEMLGTTNLLLFI